jgi:O-antigen/teichoic acid export membrane protein
MLHPASVALQLDARISLILVGALLEPADAGLYSLSLTLAGTVLLGAQTLSLAAVRRQYADEAEHAVQYTLAFARQSMLLTAAIAGVMAVLAYPFIVLVYGEAFSGSVLPFVILLGVAVAISVENPCRVLLVRVAHPLRISALVCATIAANIVLMIVLIEALSIEGAALAALISYWVLAVAMLWAVGRRDSGVVRRLFRPPNHDDEAIRLLMRIPRALRSG